MRASERATLRGALREIISALLLTAMIAIERAPVKGKTRTGRFL